MREPIVYDWPGETEPVFVSASVSAVSAMPAFGWEGTLFAC